MIAKRGEIWIANLGDPPQRHWVLIVSLDARNKSDRTDSVLIIPFGSKGAEGPTTMLLQPGESGLPRPSWAQGALHHHSCEERPYRIPATHTFRVSNARSICDDSAGLRPRRTDAPIKKPIIGDSSLRRASFCFRGRIIACRARGGRRSSKGTACRAPTSRVKLLPFRGPPGRIIARRARCPSAGSALHQAGRRHLHPGLVWARGVGGDQAALNNFRARCRSLPNCRFRKCLRARKENTGSRRGRTLPSARIRRASRGA